MRRCTVCRRTGIGPVTLNVRFSAAFKPLHSPLGVIFLVVLPGLLVIWGEIVVLRRSLAKHPKTANVSNTDRPEPPLPPAPPSPGPKVRSPKPVPPKRTRGLDGMGPRMIVVMLLALVVATAGSTYALTTTNHVTAAGKVTVSGTVPTSAGQCKNNGWKNFKNPDGSLMFKNQGQCIAFVESNSHSHNHTTIVITNINNQSASSGGGNADNANTTTTTVTVGATPTPE